MTQLASLAAMDTLASVRIDLLSFSFSLPLLPLLPILPLQVTQCGTSFFFAPTAHTPTHLLCLTQLAPLAALNTPLLPPLVRSLFLLFQRSRLWSPSPRQPPRGARLPSPSSTALALAAVTARAAELASDVAAAVHAVELQKHWPQAPLLPPLVRSLLPLFQRVLPAVVPFTSAAASWRALALPFLHPSQHLSFSFCKEKNPKTDNARSKKMAPAQRVMKRENRRWRRSRRIC